MSISTERFNLYLHSDSDLVNEITKSLSKELSLANYKQGNALKLILLNLFMYRDKRVVVSREKKSLGPARYNPHSLGYRPILSVLDRLEEHGLIFQEKGHKDLATGEGKQTLIQMKDELRTRLYLAEWSGSDIKQLNPELIRLKAYSKDGKAKDLIDYQDTGLTIKLREEVEAYYNLLCMTDISLSNGSGETQWEYEGQPIYRTFIQMTEQDSFEYGGRLYGPWASLSKMQRKALRIDGKETIEHDFCASHINTMYLMLTGSIYPDKDDPYSLCVENCMIPRHIVKKLSSILINVKSYHGAVEALSNEYHKYKSNSSKYKYFSDFELISGNFNWVDVIDAYLDKHAVISELFMKGKQMGNSIQFIEAQRVMNIINYLVSERIPVLTVYDSFIVAEEHESLLLRLMNDDSNEHMLAA